MSGFQSHDCDQIYSVDLVEIQVEESRITEIQIISTYMKIHIWNQDHLTPVVIGGIITAIFLIFIILLIIILSMKYRKDKLQSQQAEFLHSKIYNDKFVEGRV